MSDRNDQPPIPSDTGVLTTEDESLTSNSDGAVIPLGMGEIKTAIRWLTPIYRQRVIQVPKASSSKK